MVELAGSSDLDRQTVENHIRQTEQKLVDAIVEHLA
jgi:predicted DNA binding protein